MDALTLSRSHLGTVISGNLLSISVTLKDGKPNQYKIGSIGNFRFSLSEALSRKKTEIHERLCYITQNI